MLNEIPFQWKHACFVLWPFMVIVHEIWFDYLIRDKGHMTHSISAIAQINGGKCVCVLSRPTCCFIYLFCSELVMSFQATSWTLGSFKPSATVRAQTSCCLATEETLQDAYLSERQRAVKSQRATWADAIKSAKFCSFLLRFNDQNNGRKHLLYQAAVFGAN